jgi:IS5 family transposase
MADRCEKVAAQIRKRVTSKPIKDRIVSLHDPDARPIRKGKLGKKTEFGFVSQLAEVTEHTRRGARGLILPGAATQIGNPGEDTLLPTSVAEMQRLAMTIQEVALDGGFNVAARTSALEPLAAKNVFIAGRQEPGSQRTQRRLRRYRTDAEGRISHLKRRYGLDRSRLKGDEGWQAWIEWSILAYNLDTIAVRER